MIESNLREKLIARSLVSIGTRANWMRILNKKQITLSFMGGSVTQGYINGSYIPKAYPQIVSELLSDSGYSTSYSVCSDAGMDTLTGTLLSDEFVLSKKPDLVFLEYAINETTLRHSAEHFESLVRHLLDAPCQPTVCFLLMRNANDYSCSSFMRPMAEHYGLPCIDMKESLNPSIAEGELLWEDFADKEGHPDQDGHQFLAECIIHLINEARSISKLPFISPLPEPWIGAPFTSLQCIESDHVPNNVRIPDKYPLSARPLQYFHPAWDISPDSGTWTMQCRCRSIIIFYETHFRPEFGSCRIQLDNKPVRHPLLEDSILQTHTIYGWGNARNIVIINQDEPNNHTLTLEPIEKSVFLLCVAIQ